MLAPAKAGKQLLLQKQLYSQGLYLKRRGRTHCRAESGFTDEYAEGTLDVQSLGVGGGIGNRHADKCS